MKDGIHYTYISDNSILKAKYEDVNDEKSENKPEILFSVAEMDQSDGTSKCPFQRFNGYSFNSDETLILLTTAKTMKYRRSFIANYYIYDIAEKTITPLSTNGSQKCATFSPDGKHIAFVRKKNLFIYDIESKSEEQITQDGKINKIINGETDWVYEEEFEFTRAYEWSPDGQTLAYLKFDETHVPHYTLQKYCGECPRHPKNIMYPENYVYKYPKAGERNSTVTFHIYYLQTKETKMIPIGGSAHIDEIYEDGKINIEKDYYIPKIIYSNDPKVVLVFHLNRHQNDLNIYTVNTDNCEINTIYHETNKYYIDFDAFKKVQFLDDGKHFTLESEETGFNHIYVVNMENGEKKQITTGEYDVSEFYGYDNVRKLYYYSSFEESTIELYAYGIDENGNKRKLTPKKGWNTVKFSNNFNFYFVENSSSTEVPTTTLYNNEGHLIKIMEDNSELQELLRSYDIPKPEFFTVPADDGVTQINVSMIKPKGWETKKCPLVVRQYSGPNHQYVQNSWNLNWFNFLVQEGFAVASIDPRGSAAHGEQFRKCTYLQLGVIESKDVVAATRHLSKLDYIDETNIGIWGWSFGGFMTLLCLAEGPDVFSTGIAVAPVTNWKYYDSIYTERFMRTPQENPEGYENGAPLHVVNSISPSANFLICHGTADDNVHIQNTFEYTELLVQRGIQFDMAVYTNRNHGIYGGNTSLHLHTKFLNYFNSHLRGV
ncbi:putative dipeptidyl-aminopeptidase B [Tritrichomonas foetus]|uniref:Dipeptidyl-aminopeptidase B n=1 Tax=Tritrichomonas foetus TaxID=1144522 RepID=A0A1J4KG62_9EUKA|nr:putative dipeptidyl-aminopeptidase B [Tritrichomonas foetus]|eukprot:OHT10018.1 putative dipeptidyl-aminopeptidase B [Tritrichomonas foetus]